MEFEHLMGACRMSAGARAAAAFAAISHAQERHHKSSGHAGHTDGCEQRNASTTLPPSFSFSASLKASVYFRACMVGGACGGEGLGFWI